MFLLKRLLVEQNERKFVIADNQMYDEMTFLNLILIKFHPADVCNFTAY